MQQKSIAQLQKLVERKKSFLQTIPPDKQRTIDGLKAEINILENAIHVFSANELIKEEEQFYEMKQKAGNRSLIEAFVTICEMYGIDNWKQLINEGEGFLKAELKRDKEGDYVRVPNKLRQIIYGK